MQPIGFSGVITPPSPRFRSAVIAHGIGEAPAPDAALPASGFRHGFVILCA
jgi:hypothetical protein